MFMIEIDDDVWDLFKRSWALLGVREHEKLVKRARGMKRLLSFLGVLCDSSQNRSNCIRLMNLFFANVLASSLHIRKSERSKCPD
jgi:hypothetical protein